ncbi:MAG: ferric uptake regulator family protein [Dorea sp.]|nr:ferric uptake regulator family protein [Dorea sp.]
MEQEDKVKAVIRQLKDNGYRITAQRRMLLEIILENQYSSCKEIYFAAKERDRKVGMATVYRMVQILEDMELVHKEMAVRL